MRAILIVLLLTSLSGCAGLLFYPQKKHVLKPETVGINYEDVYFDALDGVKLHGWFLPAKDAALGTILFLHGNAENISTHIASVYWLPERGFNVFLLDYRGYGASQGVPGLKGVHVDAESALRYLVNRNPTAPDRLVVFGQSLGGAVAIYTVATSAYREAIKAVVVESALSSYRGIVREKLAAFWLTWPFQWFSLTVPDAFSPLQVVKEIHPIPLLVIHGDQDRIVPVAHGRRLYEAAMEPKQLWIATGARHIQATRSDVYRERLVEYLKEVLAVNGTNVTNPKLQDQQAAEPLESISRKEPK